MDDRERFEHITGENYGAAEAAIGTDMYQASVEMYRAQTKMADEHAKNDITLRQVRMRDAVNRELVVRHTLAMGWVAVAYIAFRLRRKAV